MVTMSTTGQVELFSEEVPEYFGKTREELRNWAMTDAVHPDDLARVVAAFTDSVTTGKPYSIEHRCRRADGVYRWFQVRALAVRDADERITGWYVVLVDIDDVKRAGDAVRASERNLNLIINTIPALAWSATTDGRAEFFNQHYLNYLGLSADQAKDWGWVTAVHRDDLNDLVGVWQRVMASDMPGEAEARLRRSDGEYRWFLFRVNPLRDESGKTIRWYGTNTDIDDRKRAEAELRRAYDSFAERSAEPDGQLHHGSGRGGPQLVRAGVPHLRVRAGVEGHGTADSGHHHPDDLSSFDSVIARGMSGVNVEFAFRIVTARGAVKHVRGVAHVIESRGSTDVRRRSSGRHREHGRRGGAEQSYAPSSLTCRESRPSAR
jgi:PAS domain S-box-containing protein